MKSSRLFPLALVLTLLASLTGGAAGAPLAGPCLPGAAYDPACDADHDGDVDIFDIQLTAGHWNQTGAYVSDNNHNHLGQTWTGSNTPLKLTGAYGAPEFAPLLLANTSGVGLRIVSAAGNGVYVDNAANNGVEVNTAGGDGLFVNSAQGNGVLIDTAVLNGFYVQDATLDGFVVLNAGNYGVRVISTGLDGVAVIASAGDGVDVAGATDNGIEATGTNRAGYFEGDIEVTGTCINFRIAQMAVNTGDEGLLPGQIVAVDGVATSPFDGLAMLMQVQRATPGSALLGVVCGRAEPYTSPEDSSYTLVGRPTNRPRLASTFRW